MKEIDDLCLAALNSVSLLPEHPQPIRIERFTEKYFSDAQIEYRDLGAGILGCTTFDTRGRVTSIIVSDIEDSAVMTERRLRSTTAHEAGHGLMHASLFIDDGLQREFGHSNIDLTHRRILCRQTDIGATRAKSYGGRWWEWQANRAIGGLLLPKKLVHDALLSIASVSPVTGIQELPFARRAEAKDAIVEIFDVNPMVAEIRLGEMFPLEEAYQTTF